MHFSSYRHRNGNDIDADVLPLPAGRPTSYPPELLQLLVLTMVKIRLRTNGHVEENKLRPCWRNGGQPSSWGVSIAKAAPDKDKKIGIMMRVSRNAPLPRCNRICAPTGRGGAGGRLKHSRGEGKFNGLVDFNVLRIP